MSKGIIHERIQNDLERLFDKYDKGRSKAYGQEVRLPNNKIADFSVVDHFNNVSVFEVKTSRYDLWYGRGKNWNAHYNWLVVPYDMVRTGLEFIEEHKEYKHLGLILWSEYGFLIIREANYNPLKELPKPRRKRKLGRMSEEEREYFRYELYERWFWRCPYIYYFDKLNPTYF